MTEQEALHFSGLLLKYFRKELSFNEEQSFLKSVASDPEKQRLLDDFKDGETSGAAIRYMQRLDTKDAWKKVSGRVNPGSQKSQDLNWWKWLSIAAMLTVVLTSGLYFFNGKDQGTIADNSYGFKNDVLPGRDQALLILSDGSRFELDSTNKSFKHLQGRLRSEKGEVNYSYSGKGSTASYNEIRVPASGQYKLVLPDGTKVSVNSLSALRFPVSFDEKERRVILEGEAYFDVAKDASRPFYVQVKNRTIRVLGTRFNVSAYEKDVTTTLLEGSVRITDNRETKLLEPGQQAISALSGIAVTPANLKKATAWKDEYFMFDQDNIRTIMDQLARWYKVDVHYDGPADMEVYSGSMPRSSTLGAVLQMLSDVSSLRFSIDGRSVTVLNPVK